MKIQGALTKFMKISKNFENTCESLRKFDESYENAKKFDKIYECWGNLTKFMKLWGNWDFMKIQGNLTIFM